MDTRLLELFVAVAEEGSIHGGARRLVIAQPAVSKGLRRLERTLEASLVDRSARGTALTPAGEVLFTEARDILDRIGRTAAAVRGAGAASRRITLGLIAGTVAAGDLTGEIVQAYRRERPGRGPRADRSPVGVQQLGALRLRPDRARDGPLDHVDGSGGGRHLDGGFPLDTVTGDFLLHPDIRSSSPPLAPEGFPAP